MSTFYESPFFRYLPDELEEPPRHSPIHFYSPRGYWRAIQGNWKPFFKVNLVFDIPFKNREAKGRLIQQGSSFNRTEIEVADLERTILDNVIRVIGALERAAEVVETRRSSIEYFEQTLDASMERFQAGDITLLDTLLTEEDLTRERIRLVQAIQVYLSLLARLKFEVGDLVQFRDEGTLSESVDFVPQELVASEAG
jgi:outer membrane protein TolC